MNTLKSFLLLALLSGLLLAAGAALGGRAGMMLALVVAAAMNLGTWFFADSIVIRSTGAQPVPEWELTWLHADIGELAQRAGIPKPRLYALPHEASPNAFAPGRSPDKGVVAVTAGLLQTLDRREIRGVLAHETVISEAGARRTRSCSSPS
jgi:heat shock protein HtpX